MLMYANNVTNGTHKESKKTKTKTKQNNVTIKLYSVVK